MGAVPALLVDVKSSSSRCILLKQGFSHFDLVGNNLFLGFWISSSIPGVTQAGYMAIYVSFGKI